MHTIRLIHWNEKEARERASLLKAKGLRVIHSVIRGQPDMRELRHNPPHALVIDLTRLPSQGRDIGMFVRQSKSTRNIPLIFVEGEKEKVDRIRKLLPDAQYTSWTDIQGIVKRALANPIKNPVAPKSLFEAYQGVPLLKKLGIKENTAVALVSAPKEFEKLLGHLPEGVKVHRVLKKQHNLALWFVRSHKELKDNIISISRQNKNSPIWILWPKKGSGVSSDLSQVVVRKTGLASGLVDYKICAVDTTWSGLLFTKREKLK
jgi:response regulator RpfG family c-di-GMP phosphodiesterase